MDFLNPEKLIQYGGFGLLVFIIFAETGLFFGFFLPGDSLLFLAGFVSGTVYLPTSVAVLIPTLLVAAVAGSTVGYFTGFWAGNFLENKPDTFYFKKRYIDMTREFYERHGKVALILGRFMPIIRTFVTIFAGMAKIKFFDFFIYNVVGAAAWISLMILSGSWLGNLFPWLIDYLEIIVVGMILVSVIPIGVAWRKRRLNSKKIDHIETR